MIIAENVRKETMDIMETIYLFGGRESHAGGPRPRAGNVLDRICAGLAWNTRGKGGS